VDNRAGFINLSRSLYITQGSKQKSREKKEIEDEGKDRRKRRIVKNLALLIIV